jgi:ABC-type multidrug transport system fused ATPase/permease subunit
LPLFFCTVGIFGSITKKAQGEKLKQLELLGGHTEETLSAMKLVISFAQEGITLAEYDKIATETNRIAKKAAIL